MTTAEPHSTTRLELDICTPEGKTWAAELLGTDRVRGFDRRFLNPVAKATSRSGRTGTATYLIGDGVFESNEGRRKLGRRYWIVTDGQLAETDLAGAVAALEAATA